MREREREIQPSLFSLEICNSEEASMLFVHKNHLLILPDEFGIDGEEEIRVEVAINRWIQLKVS